MRITSRPVRSTLPVNLITDGKCALVVGGGRVGLRKTRSLLSANLSVVLVSPTALDEFHHLVPDSQKMVPDSLPMGTVPKISPPKTVPDSHFMVPDSHFRGTVPSFTWREKVYDGEVLEGGWLAIFACSDDKNVNMRVLHDARKANIPCCLADGNWAQGDFTMPAILRDDDIVFSVSTNGQDCRTSRDMRDSIAEWVKSRKSPRSIAVIGISGAELGDIHLTEGRKRELHSLLSQFKCVEGWLILNTCSRVELVVAGAISPELISSLKSLLSAFICPDRFCDIVSRTGDEAFRHLSLVVSGLDSPFLGEYAIAGQFKDAIDESSREGGLAPFLAQIVSQIQQCAKEIRHKTSYLLNNPLEIQDITLDFIYNSQFLNPSAKIVVLGTGSVGTAVANLLSSRNQVFTWIFHKNRPSNNTGSLVDIQPWECLKAAIEESDIIISALSLDRPIIWGQSPDLPYSSPEKRCQTPNEWCQTPISGGLSPIPDSKKRCQTPISGGLSLVGGRKKLIVDLGQPGNFHIADDGKNDIELVTLGMLKDINRLKRQNEVVDKVREIALETISKHLMMA